MLAKVCNKCGYEKLLEDFHCYKSGARKDRPFNLCKACSKIYRTINRDKINQKNAEWRLAYPEKMNGCRKEWRENNPDKVKVILNRHIKKKKDTNPLYRCKCAVRSLVTCAIKRMGYQKNTKTEKIIGCTFKDLKLHIELQFKTGMDWLNHGEWHLDHIKPISLAKTEMEVIELNHYTNLQPLWAKDNLKKSNSYGQ